eukprot:10475263-Karenia_brevis.AAC.1
MFTKTFLPGKAINNEGLCDTEISTHEAMLVAIRNANMRSWGGNGTPPRHLLSMRRGRYDK